jgi:hypothetical protein
MATDADQPAGSGKQTAWLSRLVEAEAQRAFSEAQLAGDPALLAAGWERRFIADRRRAEEALELYRGLGFEVRAEPVGPELLGDDCSDCQLVVQRWFVMIYTRRPDARRS